MTIATPELAAGQMIDGFRLSEPRSGDGDADVVEWLATRTEGSELVSLRIPVTPAGCTQLETEWQVRRTVATADAEVGNGRLRRLDSSTVTATHFPGYLASEVVPARSLQEQLLAGEPLSNEQAVTVLEALLGLLDRCQAAGIAPPDLNAPTIHVVDQQVVVSGIGTGSFDRVGPVLRDLTLAMHGAEPDAAVRAFADSLPGPGMPVNPAHLRTLLDSVLGARRSDRLTATGAGDFTVNCPQCGKRYVLSAGACKPCRIDLRTGAPLLEIRAATRRRKRASGSSGIGPSQWLVAACLIGVIAVTGAAFGWTWVAVSIGIGVGLVGLLLSMILLGT